MVSNNRGNKTRMFTVSCVIPGENTATIPHRQINQREDFFGGWIMNNLRFAKDIAPLAGSHGERQDLSDNLKSQ